ncbi:MAG: type II toxin-antitoxin system VapC family toxin [Prolixibacteraceae bacterium]|jgi:predicted nucleic acid-binding protein|nr:type II toxin-antitoxin system VapC family toxin [Prolixibacteraceae bacterium]
MESSGVVVDTSIFIDYLRARDKKNTDLYKIPNSSIIYIPAVTLYELLMGATNEQKREDVRLLTEDVIVLPFDEEVGIRASEIYHELRSANKMIEFRDIFIAATCLVYNLSILTTNISHFQRIKGLQIENE